MGNVSIHRSDDEHPPYPYQRDDDSLAREREARMAGNPDIATETVIASGSWFEVVAAAVGVVGAGLGLIGRIPFAMASLSIIAVGVAMFVQAAAQAARWRDLSLRFDARHRRRVSVGIGAELAAGAVAILGGALALGGVSPLVLIPAAVIALGFALIFAGPAHEDVATMPPEAFRYEDLARTSSGLLVLAGVASMLLGVLGIVAAGPALTLGLIATLVIGATELLVGGTLSQKFQPRAP